MLFACRMIFSFTLWDAQPSPRTTPTKPRGHHEGPKEPSSRTISPWQTELQGVDLRSQKMGVSENG